MARLGVQPLAVTYEDVLADPQAVVDRIALLLRLPLPVPIDRVVVAQAMQRDDRSAEWRARFLAESGDEFRHL
jgi:LPS sulfotransferase NodH